MAKFILSGFADETGDTLSHQISALKRNHISKIEPRGVSGNIQGKDLSEVEAIAKELQDNGIGLSAYGSPIGKYAIEKDFEPYKKDIAKAFEICHILGTKNLRMFSFFVDTTMLRFYREEVFRRMDYMLNEAEKANITLCHENEGKIYGQNVSEVADLLSHFPTLRGVFDASNYVMADEDPYAGFLATLPSLEYVHIKDSLRFEKAIVPCGRGDGQYEKILRKLDASTNRTVFLTLEPHLHIFEQYKSIDSHKLKTGVEFADSDEAFDCAVDALKKILTKLGFADGEDFVWKK